MAKRALSPQEIKELFAFVKSKYVHHIDVQYELVDHLATAIEEEMEQDEMLSFNQALKKVYGRFPITGFTQFVQEKQAALQKYWNRKLWSYIKSYYKLPKVLLSLLFFCVAFTIHSSGIPVLIGSFWYTMVFVGIIASVSSTYISNFESLKEGKVLLFVGFKIGLVGLLLSAIYPLALSLLIVPVVLILVHYGRMGNRLYKNSQEQESILVLQMYNSGILGFCTGMVLLPLYGIDWDTIHTMSLNTPRAVFLSIFYTIVMAYLHACFTHFPKMLKQELEGKYAHLNLKLD